MGVSRETGLAVSRRLQDQAGGHCLTALDKWLLVSTAMPQEEGMRSEKLQRFSPGSELTGKMQNRLSQNFREITSVPGACPRWYMNYAMLTIKSCLLPLCLLLHLTFSSSSPSTSSSFLLLSLAHLPLGEVPWDKTHCQGGNILGQSSLIRGVHGVKKPETDFSFLIEDHDFSREWRNFCFIGD